jgi:Zn-dependent metalloprotease
VKPAFILLLSALLSAGEALAIQPLDSGRADAARFKGVLPNSPGGTVRRSAPTSMKLAFFKFNKAAGGKWMIRYDPRTGAPSALLGHKTSPYPGTPEQAARAFLQDAKPFLGIDPQRLSLTRSNKHQGLQHLWFDQSFGGVPIEFGRVVVHMTDRGEIIHVTSKFEPSPSLSLVPSISESDGLRVVAQDMYHPTAAKGSLVLLPTQSGLKLAWKYKAQQTKEHGLWVYYVDAQNGKLLLRYNELSFITGMSGQVTGTVFDLDPKTLAVTRPLTSQYVVVHDPYTPANWALTDQFGNYSTAVNGYVFGQLQGPFAYVGNSRAGSASFDVTPGATISTWTVDASAILSTPHPYPAGCPSLACPQATLSVSPPAPGNFVIKVAPYFSQFHVGTTGISAAEGGADVVDDEAVVLTTGNIEAARYSGSRGLPGNAAFMGGTVLGGSYQLRLESLSNQTFYGFDVGFSSQLVVQQVQGAVGQPINLNWTSANAADLAPDEINIFYQLNKIHDFYDSGVNCSTCDHRAAGIDNPIVAMAHFGPGFNNAFYNPQTNALYFGDGDGSTTCLNSTASTGCLALAFSGDATVIHHEYTHYVHQQIFPITNVGESGAISEGLADYFSGTSFPGAGVPDLANFLNFSIANGGNQNYVPVRTMDPVNAAGTPCPGGTPRGQCFYLFPGSWDAEIHDDSQGFSQALWLLRANGLRTRQNLNSFDLGYDSYNEPKSDRLAWEALFFYPNDFLSFVDAMVTFAHVHNTPDASGYNFACSLGLSGNTDCNNIYGAFALHGISTAAFTTAGDSLEPNNGPSAATDYSIHTPISATIFPAADEDYYSLAAGPGTLKATLNLPPAPTQGTYFAYRMLLMDANLNIVASGAPIYDVNPTASGFCFESTDCLTTSPTATLSYNVPAAGVYFVLVSAGESDFGSNVPTASTEPYTLKVDYNRFGALSGSVVNATFDNDTFAFSVTVPQYPGGVLFSYDHARLLDHTGVALNAADSSIGVTALLKEVAPPVQVGATITGQVKLMPGFAARYPAVGAAEFEVFGKSSTGDIVSLGASTPVNLTTTINDFKAFNNVFHPNRGEHATFQWSTTLPDSNASIKIYTLDGLLVKTVFQGPIPAFSKGNADWYGESDAGKTVASGVYFVRFKSSSADSLKKVVVIK